MPPVLNAIEAAMSPARLNRFSAGAGGDKHRAFRQYVWNARLCEEFYLPLQVAEITIRNAIHQTLTRRFGSDWPTSSAFIEQIPDRYKSEVRRVVNDERAAKRAGFTVDHVVAGLTFGFWVHLLTARYDDLLWQGGVKRSFPHVAKGTTREQVYLKVDRLRAFRNRVAHHFAIFDRRPTAEYQNLLDLVSAICPHTEWVVRQLANPARVISARPRF